MASAVDDFEQFFQIFARGFLAREGAEKEGEFGHELLILEDVFRDSSGIDGGVVEKFEPIPRALLETELFGPRAKGVLVPRRRGTGFRSRRPTEFGPPPAGRRATARAARTGFPSRRLLRAPGQTTNEPRCRPVRWRCFPACPPPPRQRRYSRTYFDQALPRAQSGRQGEEKEEGLGVHSACGAALAFAQPARTLTA